MKKKYTLISIMLVLATIVSVVPINAYNFTGWRITSTVNFVPSSSFSSTSKTHIGNAAGKWSSRVSYLTLLSVSSNIHSEDSYPDHDDRNYIYFVDDTPDYVGQATTWTSSGAIVTECDINLNSYYSWANGAQSGCYDVYTVILHEMGHTIGLGDQRSSSLSYNTSVMWYQAQENTTNRTPKTADYNAVDDIYN